MSDICGADVAGRPDGCPKPLPCPDHPTPEQVIPNPAVDVGPMGAPPGTWPDPVMELADIGAGLGYQIDYHPWRCGANCEVCADRGVS